jgi:hypothetical protein
MFSELIYNIVSNLENTFLNCVPYTVIEFANKIKPLIYINDVPKDPLSGCTAMHNFLVKKSTLLDKNNTVVIKNDDGSIYHSGNKFAMRSNHIYDASRKKLFNVKIFDLI